MSQKKATLSKKKKLTIEEKRKRALLAKKKREENKFRDSVACMFTDSGFSCVNSKNIEFVFKTNSGSRTTELDGVYVYENIIAVVEDTCTTHAGEHLSKKQIIFDLILKNQEEFVKCIYNEMPNFKIYFDKKQYSEKDYIIKALYFSYNDVDSEYVESATRIGIQIVKKPLLNYFDKLVKNISLSSKYEILHFLQIPYDSIGKSQMAGSNRKQKISYQGFLLPEKNSSYPNGYKIVSFYVDPDSLLKKSFVLRKNGWVDPDLSYQRILDKKKIRDMRKYLSQDKRVYLGNIIATLPSTAKINDIKTDDQLKENEQSEIKPINILLPEEYNVVGLIDGQHRIYSYHEGNDPYDEAIKNLRNKQNLLVTGIIYPDNVSSKERILFESKLFLEINSKQTNVKSELIQEIELIVNPFSPIAIAKAIVVKLSKVGALKDKLEEHVFDDGKKIKISSIISYGLKPLIKKDGNDSLFTHWKEKKEKENLFNEKNYTYLTDYIDYCVDEVNLILNAIRKNSYPFWVVGDEKRILTPTSINGFLKCLRLILANNIQRDFAFYEEKFLEIKTFPFVEYKSSQWNQLGIDLYNRFF